MQSNIESNSRQPRMKKLMQPSATQSQSSTYTDAKHASVSFASRSISLPQHNPRLETLSPQTTTSSA